MTRKTRFVAGLLICIAALLLCGCPGGSSGSGGGTITPPITPPIIPPVDPPITPIITGGTLTCNPLTIQSSQTSACTATVAGVGNFNPYVTFSVSAGTIVQTSFVQATGTSAAVFTAPVVDASTSIVVTATSLQDSTKSLAVTITVTPLVPVISGIAPNLIYADRFTIFGGIEVNGSGFLSGEILHITPLLGDVTLSQNTVPTQIRLAIAIDDKRFSPGWFDFSLTSAQGKDSNVAHLAFVGNQNTLAISGSGELFQFDPAQGLPGGSSDNGFVRKFKADGTPDGSFHVPGLASGIAIDGKTGDLIMDTGNYDANNGTFLTNPASDGNSAHDSVIAIATKNGQSCFTRPNANLVSCYVVGQNGAPLNSAQVGVQPWSLTMTQLGNELDAIVYSRSGTPTLFRVSVPDMVVRGSVTLPGIVPMENIPVTLGGWQIGAFGSGPSAGIAVLLSQADGQLVFVDIATMSVRKQVDVKALLGTGVYPFRLALDEPHGKALLAIADPDAGLTRFVSVDMTGALTTLNATSALLAVGFGVSSDGMLMYACQRDKCEALSTSTSAGQKQQQATATASATKRNEKGSAALSMVGYTASAQSSAPELKFSTSRTEVPLGRAAFLTWSATNARSCAAAGDWFDSRPTKGAETVLLQTAGMYIYTLSCIGKDGSNVAKSLTITVQSSPVVEPPSFSQLSVSPEKVRIGETAAIKWSTDGATSCIASGDIVGDQPTNGSAFIASPIPGSFTGTLTCTGPGGTVSRSVRLTVTLF